MQMRRSMAICFTLALAIMLSACSGSSSNTAANANKTSAGITIGFKTSSKATLLRGPKSAAVVGTAEEVTAITVDVFNGPSKIVNAMPLTNNNGVWTADINQLPVGVLLTFSGHAYNVNAVEIFTGSTAKELSQADHNVLITMVPVSNGTTLPFLTITQIGRPAEVLIDGSAPVSISVTGNVGETLTFSVTPAENGGSFNPDSGTFTLSGTYGTVVLGYTAPGTAGSYIHSVTVTNSRGNSVSTTFDTNVTAELINDDVAVQFSPVVTALVPVRTGNLVAFTAYVQDAGPAEALTFDWSFACSANCQNVNVSNTGTAIAYLNNYDVTVAGTLTLRVANASQGSTTVSYDIKPNQFPASVVSNIPILPQIAHHINGLNDCRFGSASGNIVALVLDESGAAADFNNDGDTRDFVLGYYDVVQNTQTNTGITIQRDNVAIDGDIIVYRYVDENGSGTTMGWYSISNQQEHPTDITPASFARSYWGASRIISNGMIAYIAATRDLDMDGTLDMELKIYNTATDNITNTGVAVNYSGYYGDEQFTPSISGDQVLFIAPSNAVKYYTISTGAVGDTPLTHTDGWHAPMIDHGIIVTDTGNGIAYYDIANAKYVLTPLPSTGDAGLSISNGLIAAVVRENATLGDLNGDGGINNGPYDYNDGTNQGNGVLVLYDIATGRMVSTGISIVCCGPEISGTLIVFDSNPCDQWYVTLDDIVRYYLGR